MCRGARGTGGIKSNKNVKIIIRAPIHGAAELIVVMREYEPREVPFECLYLQVELPEHVVATPEANQVDDITFYS